VKPEPVTVAEEDVVFLGRVEEAADGAPHVLHVDLRSACVVVVVVVVVGYACAVLCFEGRPLLVGWVGVGQVFEEGADRVLRRVHLRVARKGVGRGWRERHRERKRERGRG
jgi:hypothetical protein